LRNVFILGAVLGVFAFAHAEDKVSGDFLLDGWAFAGDSLDTDPIFWSRGNTVGGFSAYYTSFTLSNAHTVSGSTGLFGNATGSLVNGSTWQAGDLIFGMGVDSLDDNIYENGFYYKFDFTNTSNWTPASSIGALDGLSSFTTGGQESGISVFSHPHIGMTGRVDEYSLADGTVIDAENDPTAINFNSAVLHWSILDNSNPFDGSGFANPVTSQMLLNYSQLLRIAGNPFVPIDDISPSMGLVWAAYGSTNTIGMDMVWPMDFPPDEVVPEPGTIGLAALAGLAALRRIRKKA